MKTESCLNPVWGMAQKPGTDTKPIVWGYRDWSYIERCMDGANHHPAVGFVLPLVGIITETSHGYASQTSAQNKYHLLR